MRIAFQLALIAATAVSARAQQVPEEVHGGVRIRVTFTKSSGTEQHTGRVIQIRRDSVFMRDGDSGPPLEFTAGQIISLDVSLGRPIAPWTAIKAGAISGAIAGAVVGNVQYHADECQPPSTACRNDDMGLDAIKGAAIGGTLGYVVTLFKGERWKQLIAGGHPVE